MTNATQTQAKLNEQRDTFAAHALSGIMAKTANTTMPQGSREAIAKLAYQLADEMMAEREKGRAA